MGGVAGLTLVAGGGYMIHKKMRRGSTRPGSPPTADAASSQNAMQVRKCSSTMLPAAATPMHKPAEGPAPRTRCQHALLHLQGPPAAILATPQQDTYQAKLARSQAQDSYYQKVGYAQVAPDNRQSWQGTGILSC